MSRKVATEPSGTIAPWSLRVFSLLTSRTSLRNGASAWAVTRKVRPSKLKSLT